MWSGAFGSVFILTFALSPLWPEQIRQLPESVIVETTEYKCLQSQFSVLYNESMQIKTMLDETRNQLQTSKNQHLRQIEMMESEELSAQKKVRNDMIHMEDVLSQIRKEYEMLRIEFEQNMAANEQTAPINREMRHLITSLQNHNGQLKGEVHRYKRKYKDASAEIVKLRKDVEEAAAATTAAAAAAAAAAVNAGLSSASTSSSAAAGGAANAAMAAAQSANAAGGNCTAGGGGGLNSNAGKSGGQTGADGKRSDVLCKSEPGENSSSGGGIKEEDMDGNGGLAKDETNASRADSDENDDEMCGGNNSTTTTQTTDTKDGIKKEAAGSNAVGAIKQEALGSGGGNSGMGKDGVQCTPKTERDAKDAQRLKEQKIADTELVRDLKAQLK